MVWAPRIVEAIEVGKDAPDATGAMRPLLLGRPQEGVIWATPLEVPMPSFGAASTDDPSKLRDQLQRAMTAGAGVLRNAASLAATDATLLKLAESGLPPEEQNLLVVARALLAAATAREESRGAHGRTDFPQTSPAFAHRFVLQPKP
jgi:L-aspartate oxidase